MRMWLILLIIFVGVLGSWLSWTFYTSNNLETPSYTVTEQQAGFEIRRYEPYLVAKVTVSGSYDEAINQGFRILAGYIFGGNTDQSKIAMTAPVTEQVSTNIAMTAPVTEQVVGSEREITFSMPSQYTLATLPIPDDDRITFVEIPAKTVAVSEFSWFARPDRIEREKADLAQLVTAANLTPIAEPMYAAYNDPFSFPPLRRHEILLEIAD